MELAEAQEVATQLIDLHGLHGWTFRFNRNKRRLGVCKQDTKRVELSEHYVIRNSSEHVIDTILHELAHAIVGTEHGHDDVWKAMCLRLGCSPQSCSSTAVMPEGYWQARCPGCHSTFTRHRKPRRLRGRYCVACGPDSGQLVFRDMRTVKVARSNNAAASVAKTTQLPVQPVVIPQQVVIPQEKPKQLFLKLIFS